jgi:hypothetical protein
MKYEKIGEANSRAEADVIKSFLEAEEIDVELFLESITTSAYSLAMARVQIFVPREQAEEARELLKEFDDIKPEEDEDDEGDNEEEVDDK